MLVGRQKSRWSRERGGDDDVEDDEADNCRSDSVLGSCFTLISTSCCLF